MFTRRWSPPSRRACWKASRRLSKPAVPPRGANNSSPRSSQRRRCNPRLFCLEHEDLSTRSALLAPCGDKELSPRGHEKSRLRSPPCWQRPELFIMVGVLLQEDLDQAWRQGSGIVSGGAADDINPAFAWIVEDVIRKQAGVEGKRRDRFAGLCIEHKQF